MNLILALRHCIFSSLYMSEDVFFVCIPVSKFAGWGGLQEGSDKMGHQLLPTLPLCPHFPLPRPLLLLSLTGNTQLLYATCLSLITPPCPATVTGRHRGTAPWVCL